MNLIWVKYFGSDLRSKVGTFVVLPTVFELPILAQYRTWLFRVKLVQSGIYWERVELKGRDAFEIENAFVSTAAGSSLLPISCISSASPTCPAQVQPHLNSTQFPAQVTTDWSVQTMNCLQIVIIQKKDRDRDHVETSAAPESKRVELPKSSRAHLKTAANVLGGNGPLIY